MPSRIPLHQATFGRDEATALAETLAAGRVSGKGAVCGRAEVALSRLLAAPHVFLTPSRTAAMELAWMALGVGRSDDVLLPSFTFASCATAILRCGATPVFVDVDLETLIIDCGDLERHITARSRAVLAVHYGDGPCDISGMLDLARRHDLYVVEDAAQAFGSQWQSRALGTSDDVGCLSIRSTRNVTCGEGGAFVTHDEELASLRTRLPPAFPDAPWPERSGVAGAGAASVETKGQE